MMFTVGIASTTLGCALEENDTLGVGTDTGVEDRVGGDGFDVRDSGGGSGGETASGFLGPNPADPCSDDAFEYNDQLGFAASWEGDAIAAVACPLDSDFYQIEDERPWGKVVLQQGPEAIDDGGGLRLELYCETQLCDLEEAQAQDESVSPSACDCSDDARIFVWVGHTSAHISPANGTPYRLLLQ
jgi:hypothetical protein